MKFIDEFKQFISRGNVMDMAVGVVIGGAFTSIVNSLVANIITPVISVMLGKINIADLAVHITDELTIPYGAFLQSIIDFLLISLAVFCMVKTVNNIKAKFEKKKEEEKKEDPTPSNEELLLTEIRDLLKNK